MSANTNSTMDRRFSLNMTHIPHPIAESTCLNGTNKTPTHFQWGGSPISPKNRSSSTTCLSNGILSNTHTTDDVNKNCALSPTQMKANKSKIDPRIYADVQSKGLASRIVKYHENGHSLTRSLSVNNLYSKPGHFPIVHLTKTELPYRATKQNLSMTRIAPPEKSMFYGNTLSSLLRSNSIIGLQKTNEEISRENRPIMHPPPTEGEMAPTRSVLDVLKEISRKRINSDEVSATDATKKYCNRDTDIVDTPQIPHMSQTTGPTQSYKRHRDHLTQQQQQQTTQKQVASGMPNYFSLNKTNSPEQVAKKRLCSYNNDISSSLSSSQSHTNKRKLFGQRRNSVSSQFNRLNGLRTYSTISAIPEPTLAYPSKVPRQQSQLYVDVPLKTFSCNYPPTSTTSSPSTKTVTTSGNIETEPISVPPQRTVSEPVYLKALKAPINKPKLTLFNKDYEENSDSAKSEQDNNSSLEDGNYAGIQFVKPKKSSAITGIKNPLIERTQKSKLALMLCGLRGELYQGDDDEVDAQKREDSESLRNTDAIATKLGEVSKDVEDITLPSSTLQVSLSTQTITKTSITSTITTAVEGGSLLSKETAPINTISTLGTIQSSANPLPISTPTTQRPGADFKFTPPTTSSVVSPTNKTISPLVGIKLTPQTATSTSATPIYSFGSPAANLTSSNGTSLTPNTSSTGLPVLTGFPTGGFKFDSPTTTANIIQSTFGQPTATTAATETNLNLAQTFSFGSTSPQVQTTAAPTLDSTAFGTPAASTSISFRAPSFGSNGVTGDTNTAVASTASKPFNFSAGNNNTTVANPMPIFGSVATSTTSSLSSTTTTPTFSFGLPQPQQQLQTSTTFDVSDTSKPTAIPFAFGSSTNKLESNHNLFFGGNTAAVQPGASNLQHAGTTNLFGGGTAITTSNISAATNIFGASLATVPATTTNTPSSTANLFAIPTTNALTGIVKPSFGDGSSTSTLGAAKPLFGAPVSSEPSTTGINTFGSLSSNQSKTFSFGTNVNPYAASTTNLFATSTATSNNQSSTFSFGTAALAAQTVKPLSTSSNGFGSLANNINALSGPSAGTFTFGSPNIGNANKTGNFFGSAAASGNTAPTAGTFSFGGTNNANATNLVTNTVAPFSFTVNSASTTAAPSKPFTFGNNTIDKPVANVFGTAAAVSSHVSAVPANKPVAFNFTGNTATAAAPTAGPIFGTQSANTSSNIFAPSASPFMASNGERVIRRATRRLHKT